MTRTGPTGRTGGAGLTPLHLSLAIVVMAVWGSNFVVVKHALIQLPPLTLAVLRFSVVFLPAALFVRRPPVAWRNLAAYGVSIGAGQFGALFVALRADITPGLASLMMQSQVIFTILMSVVLTGERVARGQIVALALSVMGMVVIAVEGGGSVTPLGFALIGFAALSWATGNLVARSAGRVDMLGYIVWSALFAVPPLFALALVFEGWPRILAGVRAADASTWVAVAWQAVGNAMFGYGVWGWLLARFPAATVAPIALLIPIFGLGSAAWFLGEPLQPWKLAAAALVIGGVGLGVLAGRRKKALIANDG